MYEHERSLVKKLADKPFVILGINSDKDREVLKEVIAKEKLTWRSWWDGGDTHGPIQTSYNVSHWPTIFVLDYKGVIRYFDVRGRELDDAIDKLLEEVAKEGS
jgi:thioredoxin family protein